MKLLTLEVILMYFFSIFNALLVDFTCFTCFIFISCMFKMLTSLPYR